MNCLGENCGRLDTGGQDRGWSRAGQLSPLSLREERMPPCSYNHLVVPSLLPFAL